MKNLQTVSPNPHAPRRVQPRVERTANLLVVASACTLETLPIFCWLLVLAAYNSGDPNAVLMPFWWMWVLTVIVCGLGVFFIRSGNDNPDLRRRNMLLLICIIAALGPFSLLVAFMLSPLVQSSTQQGDSGALVALALLIVWLWFRGLRLGSRRIVREQLYRAFVIALGVTITALAAVAAIQGSARGLTASYLALLLALLLFAGPMGLSLAQARDALHEMRTQAQERNNAALPPIFTRSWLAGSLGLSLGLSLLALLLATIFSRESVSILAVAAGNVMNGLLAAITFVLTPVLLLFALILNGPIAWLVNLFKGTKRPIYTVPVPPPQCTPTPASSASAGNTPVAGTPTAQQACTPPAPVPSPSLIPSEWFVALRWGVISLAIVVVLVLLVRALYRLSDQRREGAYSDERTMLDAREILRGQMRRFLDAFRRKPAAEAMLVDLASGSVRRLYRDTLVAAAAMGHARRDAETPEEFEQRLTHAETPAQDAHPPDDVAAALDGLTHAYEQARYGSSETEMDAYPASPETQTAAETVRRWLTRKPHG